MHGTAFGERMLSELAGIAFVTAIALRGSTVTSIVRSNRLQQGTPLCSQRAIRNYSSPLRCAASLRKALTRRRFRSALCCRTAISTSGPGGRDTSRTPRLSPEPKVRSPAAAQDRQRHCRSILPAGAIPRLSEQDDPSNGLSTTAWEVQMYEHACLVATTQPAGE